MRKFVLTIPAAAAAALALAALAAPSDAQEMGARPQAAPAAATSPALFDDAGALVRPRTYRRWVFVGAPLTPNDMNDGHAAFPEFHSVYVDPASYDHFKQSGTWRDGTVVLKELVSVGTKASSSGKGYFMGEFLGLEAAVKSRRRFPDAPGNWGFFRFTDEHGGAVHEKATALPQSACAACHQASANDDLIFTQHYPVLRAAKAFGEGDPENR